MTDHNHSDEISTLNTLIVVAIAGVWCRWVTVDTMTVSI